MAFTIRADVPPGSGDGQAFGLTLQFQSNGVNLGAANATTLDFTTGIEATRSGDTVTVAAPPSLQFESNNSPLGSNDATTLNFGDGLSATRVGDQVNLTATTSSDAEIIPGLVFDGTDNGAALAAAIGPTGSFVTGNKTRAKPAQGGIVQSNRLNDVHPSVSLLADSRGAVLGVPGDNLPGATSAFAGYVPPSGVSDGSGAEAAFLRIVRDTPDSASNLAWAFQIRGWNLDARGTTQTNWVDGIRIPNPSPAKNPIDPDPNYNGNKDYVAGTYVDMDVIGWSGTGITVEAGNGRFYGHSVRCLNNGGHGFDFGGNDVVMGGHWAAGGNDGFGLKLGKAGGFYGWGGNIWSNPDTRGLTGGAVWVQQRNYFVIGGTEFNDWARVDGGTNYMTGGIFVACMMHPHGVNYVSDGVLKATSGSDGREQSNVGITEYWNFNLMWNHSVRTDGIHFATPGNFGGDLTGKNGTAPPQLWNLGVAGSQVAMVNICDAVNTAPDVKPWTSFAQTVTAVADDGNGNIKMTCNGHGMQTNHRVGFYTTGTAPTNITPTTGQYYVLALDNNHFSLSLDPITNSTPNLLAFGSTGTGLLTFYNLSTSHIIQDKGNLANWLRMDSYRAEFRYGALCPKVGSPNIPANAPFMGTHGHFVAVINENDDSNPDYDFEIGDRAGGRGAIYGSVELGQVVSYRDEACIHTSTTDGGLRNLDAFEAKHFFSTSGGGISAFTINFEVDADATYDFELQFTGGTITTLNWGLWSNNSGTDGIVNPNTLPLPASSPGIMTVRGTYRRDTNDIRITSVIGGSAGMPMGRIGGGAIEDGIVGQRKRTFVQSSSAVALTSGTAKTTNSITLPPGDWSIWASPGLIAAGSPVVSECQWAISATDNSLPGTKDEAYGGRQLGTGGTGLTANAIFSAEKCFTDVNISVSTTYYMVQEATFTGGTSVSGFGSLVAYRRG